MPTHDSDPATHLPLSEAVFEILLAVADRPRHGYGIMQEVERRTEGRVLIGPGTLYGAIKRLRRKGLLGETDEGVAPTTDERRRYYSLTSFGREVAAREAKRLERLVEGARGKRLLPRASSA